MTACPECRTRSCEELFHVVLALDHSRRPPWGPLHGVTVSCFLLQHPGRLRDRDRARPWATLHTYLDGGLPAVTRLAEAMRRANSHHVGGGISDAVPVASLGPTPEAFDVTIGDVAVDGTFPAAGFADRVGAWAAATVAAWRA